jgi:hypothetical protein
MRWQLPLRKRPRPGRQLRESMHLHGLCRVAGTTYATKRYTEKCNSENALSRKMQFGKRASARVWICIRPSARTRPTARYTALGPKRYTEKCNSGKSVIPKNAIRRITDEPECSADACAYVALGPYMWPSARTRRHLPAQPQTAQVANLAFGPKHGPRPEALCWKMHWQVGALLRCSPTDAACDAP